MAVPVHDSFLEPANPAPVAPDDSGETHPYRSSLIVAGVCYVLAWEVTQAFLPMDFGAAFAKSYIEQQKAAGITGDALVKLTADMDEFARNYHDPLYRLPMTFIEIFPVGVLVSLVTAALLRNSRFLALRRA